MASLERIPAKKANNSWGRHGCHNGQDRSTGQVSAAAAVQTPRGGSASKCSMAQQQKKEKTDQQPCGGGGGGGKKSNKKNEKGELRALTFVWKERGPCLLSTYLQSISYDEIDGRTKN
jgi:hypothetical protein